jgi:hypothetical protein
LNPSVSTLIQTIQVADTSNHGPAYTRRSPPAPSASPTPSLALQP